MSGKSKTGAAHRAPRRSIADLIDQKEILTADGRIFEEVPMAECAIHYDGKILRGLAWLFGWCCRLCRTGTS